MATKPTLRQIVDGPGTDQEKEEAAKHFYPETFASFSGTQSSTEDADSIDEKALKAVQSRFTINPNGPMQNFAQGAAEMLNPISMVKGAAGMVMHPIDNIIRPMLIEKQKAEDAAQSGERVDNLNATGHEIAGSIPMIGPFAASIMQQAENDPSGAAGKFFGSAVMGPMLHEVAPMIPEAAASTVKAAQKGAAEGSAIAGDAVTGLKKAASDPMTTVAASTAGTLGHSVGGNVGAAVAAGGVAALRAIPEVFQAVKKGIMERRNVSGAQAEMEMMKMPPEELQKAVEQNSQVKASSKDANRARNMDRIYQERTNRGMDYAIPEAERGRFKKQTTDQSIEPAPDAQGSPQSAPGSSLPPAMLEQAKQRFQAAQAPSNPDMVYAPPAFPGQQSGGTQARFRYVADRLAANSRKAAGNAVVSDMKKWAGEKLTDDQMAKRLSIAYGIDAESAPSIVSEFRKALAGK